MFWIAWRFLISGPVSLLFSVVTCGTNISIFCSSRIFVGAWAHGHNPISVLEELGECCAFFFRLAPSSCFRSMSSDYSDCHWLSLFQLYPATIAFAAAHPAQPLSCSGRSSFGLRHRQWVGISAEIGSWQRPGAMLCHLVRHAFEVLGRPESWRNLSNLSTVCVFCDKSASLRSPKHSCGQGSCHCSRHSVTVLDGSMKQRSANNGFAWRAAGDPSRI